MRGNTTVVCYFLIEHFLNYGTLYMSVRVVNIEQFKYESRLSADLVSDIFEARCQTYGILDLKIFVYSLAVWNRYSGNILY